MCGIAGIILKQKSDLNIPETVLKLSRAIKHRGPDGEGVITISPTQITSYKTDHSPSFSNTLSNYIPKQNLNLSENNCTAAFAHRRLSIIDLSEAGHQPMCCKDAKIWITFNGEIYNYIELKEELKNKGYGFVSETDTEVVLNAYKHWGKNCVEKFNGMWAFCIYDSANQIYFASRDRLGVKPFYYLNNQSFLAFSSEQKAFIKSRLIKPQINEKALHHYLINDTLEFETANFFKEVYELWPGTNLIYNAATNELKTERYYNLNENVNLVNDTLSDEELTQRIKEKLTHAVKIRLRSDVEVGSCLSGGIDSSALVGLITEAVNKPVFAFTSVYKHGATNEEKFAESVSKKNNSKHFKTYPDLNGFEKDFENLIYALDAPIWDSSTYSQFRVMQLAAENKIKVVLDGQGADELFAGYHHHYLAQWKQIKKEQGLFSAIAEANKSSNTISSPLKFWIKQELKNTFPFLQKNRNSFFKSDFVSSFETIPSNKLYSNVNKQLLDDVGYKRLKSFLRCEDRCGMWHGVESRTPFSDDIELINLLFSFNGKRKIKNGVSKYFLREASKHVLPAEIYNRKDKVGFETPMNEWLGKLSPQIFESLNANDFPYLNLNNFKSAYNANNLMHNKLLLKLHVLNTWKKVFS